MSACWPNKVIKRSINIQKSDCMYNTHPQAQTSESVINNALDEGVERGKKNNNYKSRKKMITVFKNIKPEF